MYTGVIEDLSSSCYYFLFLLNIMPDNTVLIKDNISIAVSLYNQKPMWRGLYIGVMKDYSDNVNCTYTLVPNLSRVSFIVLCRAVWEI